MASRSSAFDKAGLVDSIVGERLFVGCGCVCAFTCRVLTLRMNPCSSENGAAGGGASGSSYVAEGSPCFTKREARVVPCVAQPELTTSAATMTIRPAPESRVQSHICCAL